MPEVRVDAGSQISILHQKASQCPALNYIREEYHDRHAHRNTVVFWHCTVCDVQVLSHKLYVQLASRIYGTPNASVLSVGSDRDDKSPSRRLPSEPVADAHQTSFDDTSSIGRFETIIGVDVLVRRLFIILMN